MYVQPIVTYKNIANENANLKTLQEVEMVKKSLAERMLRINHVPFRVIMELLVMKR